MPWAIPASIGWKEPARRHGKPPCDWAMPMQSTSRIATWNSIIPAPTTLRPCPQWTAARAVFRHNTVHDGFLEFFGVDSRPRGTVSFEVYDNTFTGKCFCAIGLKGRNGGGVQ